MFNPLNRLGRPAGLVALLAMLLGGLAMFAGCNKSESEKPMAKPATPPANTTAQKPSGTTSETPANHMDHMMPNGPTTQPEATAGSYPLDVCVVSGDELGGEMGPPVIYHYQGREVRFCCKSCIPEFEKDPAKYLAKLDAAAKAKTPDGMQ
ncbi:MAG: hypothetical protein BIFFINMI_03614 [Phycisphaerae bacterium]|nr:hypothetical protein [Phycisphaerae bacterium]